MDEVYQIVCNTSIILKIIFMIYIILLIISIVKVHRYGLPEIVFEKTWVTIFCIIAEDIVIVLLFLFFDQAALQDSLLSSYDLNSFKIILIPILVILLIFLTIMFAFLIYYCGFNDALSIAVVFSLFSVYVTVVFAYCIPIFFVLIILKAISDCF